MESQDNLVEAGDREAVIDTASTVATILPAATKSVNTLCVIIMYTRDLRGLVWADFNSSRQVVQLVHPMHSVRPYSCVITWYITEEDSTSRSPLHVIYKCVKL